MCSLRTVCLAAFALAATTEAMAGNNGETDGKKGIAVTAKLSGYVIGQYQAMLKEGDNSNSFDVRMVRLALGGRLLDDIEYKVQAQINGNTATLGSSPRIVDAYAEWQHFGFFKVKAGQFKRPFTFENPMHPIDQGFMGYSQNVSKLAGFNDRSGEHASNGRDIGVQIQGDLLPDHDGRTLLHYQVGAFNGQGINTKDVDNRKDIIGGVWVSPVEGLRIGAFGWTGSKARNGKWTDTDGTEHSGTVVLPQHRYAFSAEYKARGWQLRSEYIHSTGYAFKTTYQKQGDQTDATVNTALGNKADGVYALCIAPVIPGKLAAKARYDLYRPQADWSTSRTQYEAGLNWMLNKSVELHAEYALINDRSLAKHNYSVVDLQFSVRF